VFRNLIVVMIDTLRADHLPSYGYHRDTAPHLARMASEGIQLDGYPASSWTKPSVATLMTGHSPQRHQAIGRTDVLPEDVPYLPAWLDDRGFLTVAYVGNRNAGRKWGFGRGYDRFRQNRPAGKPDGLEINERTLNMMQGVEPPYLLYVHYVDPHDPYEPAHPWGVEDPHDHPWIQPRRLERAQSTATEADFEAMRDQYDGEIAEVDAAIEQLLAELGARGLLEDTLVVVTSDHGEEFGEHGGMTHGQTLYEEVLHVPLILWAEARLSPCADSRPFHQIDLAPTLLVALGFDPPEGVEGRNRWPELADCRIEGDSEPLFFHLDLDERGALAVRRETAKVIVSAETESEPLRGQRFDLENDPEELAPSPLDASSETLLDRLLRHHEREGARAFGRTEGVLVRDSEDWRALAALGYVDESETEDELGRRVLPSSIERSDVE
jgi:arylsulfatase A-like enzyme